METRRAAHPAAELLKAFGLGKLDDSSSGALLAHLNHCADCRKIVASQSGDDFLDRLRQAHSRNATPAPPKSLGGMEGKPKPPPGPTTLFNLPPELADNPQYEIIKELGQGGMGVVYLAKNKLMDRLEVLKVINKALLDRAGAVERFLREIRSAAKLNHVNVVAAYSALQLGDLLVFAMEYVEGQDLAAMVKANGSLPVAHACFYVQQAAHGLQHAFEKKMVHRDIKPQNLILAREGRKHLVKILDFGLAKVALEKADETGLTGEGNMLGTPDYMAPEQTRDAASADIRADIYSLGCTLYFLLTGQRPFKGKNLFEIMQAHQSLEAPGLSAVRPEVSAELAAVVRKMMAKDRAQRYQTPLEVVQALGPFVKQPTQKPSSQSSSALSATPPTAASGKSTAPRREASAGWDALTESSLPSAAPSRHKTVRKRRSPAAKTAARNKWLMVGGIAAILLLLALVGMWAGGVFKVKTKHGTIVLENLPAGAVVEVDGETVKLNAGDGKPITIRVTAGRKHRLQVRKEGFKVFGQDVEIDTGERWPLRVRLEPVKTAAVEPRPVDAPPRTAPRRDYDDLAKGRWVAVLPSVEEFNRLLAEKAYRGTEPKYVDGVLECSGSSNLVFPSIQAKDVIVRAWVKKLGPKYKGNVHFGFRNANGENVGGGFNGGGYFYIGRMRNGSWKDFTFCQLPEPYDDFFEFALAVVGDRLFAYANGRKILETRDDAPLDRPATVMVGTHGSFGLFRDIEVQVLDKPSAEEQGFVPLFNGKDLTGWKTHPDATGDWKVEKGILIGRGPKVSHLYSQRGDYGDFYLLVEAKINQGGNSGVLFHKAFTSDWKQGYEAQIDSSSHKNKTGTLYVNAAPGVGIEKVLVPIDTWFTQEVIVRGNHIIIKINGDKTADFVDVDKTWSAGHIALQVFDKPTVVQFRRVEIKELPP